MIGNPWCHDQNRLFHSVRSNHDQKQPKAVVLSHVKFYDVTLQSGLLLAPNQTHCKSHSKFKNHSPVGFPSLHFLCAHIFPPFFHEIHLVFSANKKGISNDAKKQGEALLASCLHLLRHHVCHSKKANASIVPWKTIWLLSKTMSSREQGLPPSSVRRREGRLWETSELSTGLPIPFVQREWLRRTS